MAYAGLASAVRLRIFRTCGGLHARGTPLLNAIRTRHTQDLRSTKLIKTLKQNANNTAKLTRENAEHYATLLYATSRCSSCVPLMKLINRYFGATQRTEYGRNQFFHFCW